MNRKTIEEMRTTLSHITRGIVRFPDQVTIESQITSEAVVFTIRTAEGETGKLIGRGGRIARSLRIIMTAIAAQSGTRVLLNIPTADEIAQ